MRKNRLKRGNKNVCLSLGAWDKKITLTVNDHIGKKQNFAMVQLGQDEALALGFKLLKYGMTGEF